MKKISFIMLVALLFGGFLLLLPDRNYQNDKTGDLLAIYIQDSTSQEGYKRSNSSTFPTTGYILNTDKTLCQNGGIITQNAETKKLNLQISSSDSCKIYFDKDTLTTIAYGLKANVSDITEYTNGNQKEMYTFTHNELSTQTVYNNKTYIHSASQVSNWSKNQRTDYRYIGPNPNNWLKFNDENWRIIGIFTVETASGSKKQLLKIIRNDSIGSLPYNSTDNDWTYSTLHTILEENYYNRTGNYSSTGLNETSRNQIEQVKFYLGGSLIDENLSGKDYYNFERGTKTCQTEGTCSNARDTNIVQKVGLMYPSDYMFTFAYGVDGACFSNGYYCTENRMGAPTQSWLYTKTEQWTLTPHGTNWAASYSIQPDGHLHGSMSVKAKYTVRPVVYLKSTTVITGGKGTKTDSYTISN